MHLTATVVLILCLGLSVSTRPVCADGLVGCLFSETLCDANIEWCFDDYAFGKCIPLYENEEDLDLYQYDLKEDSLRLLKEELERLIGLGYRWSHFYTQCVLKALLFAFRYEDEYDENSCGVYTEDDQKPALTFSDEDGILGDLNPKDFSRIQFTSDFGDAPDLNNIYIPVYEKEEGIVFPHKYELPSNGYYNDVQRALVSNLIIKNERSKTDHTVPITEVELLDDISPNYLSYLNELATEETSNYAQYPDYLELIRKFHFTDRYNTPDHFRAGFELKDNDRSKGDFLVEDLFENRRNILRSFSKNYNTPEKFRKGHETKDEVFYPKLSPPINVNDPSGYYAPEERQLAYDNYNSFEGEELGKSLGNVDGVYTEGGVVYPKYENREESSSMSPLDELIRSYNNGAFKRPERLDVKKPGPSFSINNFAFKKEKESETATKETDKTSELKLQQNEMMMQPEKKKVGSPMESPILRRQTTTVMPLKEKDSGHFDGGYALLTLKDKINTWQEGSRIIRKLENILRLTPNTFSNVKVGQNEIRFKVEPNLQNMNASDVVRAIENNKDIIQRVIGLEIISSETGDQNKPPASMSLVGGDERQLWILSFLLCGVIAAAAIAGAALLVIKRHSQTKDKLQNLSQLDSEASKDYQDLCRARMATKTSQDKPDGNNSGHRVTNLAKESEGSNHSPSSRSSTSSWSEEPVLTNMDISTGHMVLSYMEDHLKNKDRLEQEWIALCAYEAEPCATIIALKEENSQKNRYTDVLPYDHARVILNELSNISGSDYINASTITDHDPRNPAYIATQGPLPNTAADFWQMVWEQGSVVMVMLTRLTENGTALCHRYWPEEGSELYHIYEVHLVSEHIWCDDYLVRSFYLKNLKTGETRTVTQFHFLSWPENGIPLSTKALLEFRRKVNKSYRGRSCPIVVHCSDGVGRTGTYCLIDMVLNRMAKGAKEIDIAATLEHIRDQRPLMVRTKQQFEFVLMAVAEEVHAILKALPTNPNHSPPSVLKEKE